MDLVLRLSFGLIYTAGYLVSTFITLGAGHGTTLFLSFFIPWFLFLSCLVLLSWADSADIRKGILIVMFLNYFLALMLFLTFELPNGFSDTIKYTNLEPEVMVFSAGWYVFGQAVFWLLYLRKGRILAGELS